MAYNLEELNLLFESMIRNSGQTDRSEEVQIQARAVSLPPKVNLMMSRLPLKLDRVEVKPSSRHGRGVFAKEVIHPGELITFYPGDSLLIAETGRVIKSSHARAPCGDKDYALVVNSSYSIVGDPREDTSMAYIGQLVNDGGSEKNAGYYLIQGCHMAIIATQTIQPGQEVLTNYGDTYWDRKNGPKN